MHIIETLAFDIAMPGEDQAFAGQDRLQSFLKGPALRVIESVFDETSPAGECLRLDELSLDLGELRLDDLPWRWEQRLREALRAQLSAQLGANLRGPSSGPSRGPSPAHARAHSGEWPSALRPGAAPPVQSGQTPEAPARPGPVAQRLSREAAEFAALQHYLCTGTWSWQVLPAQAAAGQRWIDQQVQAHEAAVVALLSPAPPGGERSAALTGALTGALKARQRAAVRRRLALQLSAPVWQRLRSRMQQGAAMDAQVDMPQRSNVSDDVESVMWGGPDVQARQRLQRDAGQVDLSDPSDQRDQTDQTDQSEPSDQSDQSDQSDPPWRAATRSQVLQALARGQWPADARGWSRLMRHDAGWLRRQLRALASDAERRERLAAADDGHRLVDVAALMVPGQLGFLGRVQQGLQRAATAPGQAAAGAMPRVFNSFTLAFLLADRGSVFNRRSYLRALLQRLAVQQAVSPHALSGVLLRALSQSLPPASDPAHRELLSLLREGRGDDGAVPESTLPGDAPAARPHGGPGLAAPTEPATGQSSGQPPGQPKEPPAGQSTEPQPAQTPTPPDKGSGPLSAAHEAWLQGLAAALQTGADARTLAAWLAQGAGADAHTLAAWRRRVQRLLAARGGLADWPQDGPDRWLALAAALQPAQAALLQALMQSPLPLDDSAAPAAGLWRLWWGQWRAARGRALAPEAVLSAWWRHAVRQAPEGGARVHAVRGQIERVARMLGLPLLTAPALPGLRSARSESAVPPGRRDGPARSAGPATAGSTSAATSEATPAFTAVSPRAAASPLRQHAKVSNHPVRPAESWAARAGRDSVPAPQAQPLYLANAGLVLLAPYLPRLFDRLGWLEARALRSVALAGRAAHLLQWAVTGTDGAEEHALVLNKLLCGLPLHTPLPFDALLTEQERDTAFGLLQSVIAHWTALGATSVQGLRETFLQREGRLLLQAQDGQPEAWQLQVQPQAFDMLLDRLPWSVALIRLPWMERALHVHWR